MKKLFVVLVVAGMCFVACGPSAEQKAKEEALVEAEAKAAEAEAKAAEAEAAKLAAEAEAARLAEEQAAAEEEAAKAKKVAPATKKTTTVAAEPVKTEPAKPAEEPKGKSKLSGMKQTN